MWTLSDPIGVCASTLRLLIMTIGEAKIDLLPLLLQNKVSPLSILTTNDMDS